MRGFNDDLDWMRRKAEAEDGSFVSVAGSLHRPDEEKREMTEVALDEHLPQLINTHHKKREQ